MARETRRMALYEAIRKGQSKRSGRKKTVRFRPFAAGRRASATRKKEVGYYQRIEDGGHKGKLAALWTPRVNLALPYPVVGVLLVAAAALLVAAFRFGQLNYDAKWLFFEPVAVSESVSGGQVDNKEVIDQTLLELENIDLTTDTDNEIVENDNNEDIYAGQTQGANVIVIQEYKDSRELEPVKKHFEDNGIETEILERRGYFFLVTKARFHGFGSGTDGEPALKKIVEIGATYKAPPEYGRFPGLFKDAYGRKLDNF